MSYDPVREARGQITCALQLEELAEAKVISSGDSGVV